MPEPQVKNKFPDCVMMKLHVKATAADSRPSPPLGFVQPQPAVANLPKALDLGLTINFSGEQEIEVPGGKPLGLPGGRATFGIRRGHLRFSFQNCNLPLEKVALVNPLKVSIAVEQQNTRSTELQVGAVTNSLGITPKVTGGATEKATVEVFQVKKFGSEDKPGWVFETYNARNILEGSLAETLLGILHILNRPCELKADFTVRGEDVQITWGQIGQVKDTAVFGQIGDNKAIQK
jgi:hypothetical protein